WRTLVEGAEQETDGGTEPITTVPATFVTAITAGSAVINETAFTHRIYWVPAGAPTRKVKVTWSFASTEKERVKASFAPYETEVPLPPYAESGAGTDKQVSIIQPSSGKEWDFGNLKWSEKEPGENGGVGKGEPEASDAGYVANYNEALGFFED